jgi:hypothetical protein
MVLKIMMPIMPKNIRNRQRSKEWYTWGKKGVLHAIDVDGFTPDQSERDLILDRQSCAPASRPHAVTSQIAASGSGGWGTIYSSRSLMLACTGQMD